MQHTYVCCHSRDVCSPTCHEGHRSATKISERRGKDGNVHLAPIKREEEVLDGVGTLGELREQRRDKQNFFFRYLLV